MIELGREVTFLCCDGNLDHGELGEEKMEFLGIRTAESEPRIMLKLIGRVGSLRPA